LFDITVCSSLVDMLHVTSSNGKCMCAAFRPLEVTKKQANKCEYALSGLVRFQSEHISAVTDLIIWSRNSGRQTVRSLTVMLVICKSKNWLHSTC